MNDEPYRWTISAARKGRLMLTAEHGKIKGCNLRVAIDSDINEFWVEFPYVEQLNLKVVKPKEIAEIIAAAIREGWDAKQPGPPCAFYWDGHRLMPIAQT